MLFNSWDAFENMKKLCLETDFCFIFLLSISSFSKWSLLYLVRLGHFSFPLLFTCASLLRDVLLSGSAVGYAGMIEGLRFSVKCCNVLFFVHFWLQRFSLKKSHTPIFPFKISSSSFCSEFFRTFLSTNTNTRYVVLGASVGKTGLTREFSHLFPDVLF